MKKTITLTKMLSLVLLLVTFTTASASFGGDEKCKTKCCKDKKEKEMKLALAELDKAMNKLEAELKTVTAVLATTEVRQSLERVRIIRTKPVQFISYSATTESATVDAKYKINFSDLEKEMDKEQEKMTTAPDMSQKIDFSNLDKEMNDVQEQMSSYNGKNL